jgi:type IV pilus assembly protein PilO
MSLSARKLYLLTAAVLALVLVAGWFLLISPKRSEAADLQAQAADQVAKNDQLRVQVVQLAKAAEHIPEQKAKIAEIRQRIPEDARLPTLIRALSDAAKGANVELVSLAPGSPSLLPSATPTKPATGAQQSGAAAAPSGLYDLPVQIQIAGSYYDVEQFLGNLEDLERETLVSGFTLALDSGDKAPEPAVRKSPRLTVTLQGHVFVAPSTGTLPNAAVTNGQAAPNAGTSTTTGNDSSANSAPAN